MAYKQNNPFSRKSSSPLKALDPTAYTSYADRFANPDFNKETDDFYARELARKKAIRGTDTYGKVADSARGIMSPYAKHLGTNKRYPYLSSSHHAGVNIHNPMQTNARRSRQEDGTYIGDVVLTMAEQRKATQDRLLSGAGEPGTRGSSYYGAEFNRKAEKAAQQAAKRHEYLLNAASQGEAALNAALSTAEQPNKHGVMVTSEMPVRANYPMDYDNPTNLDESYAANPSGQSLRNIHAFEDLRDRASAAQTASDNFRNVGYDADETMRKFDQSDYRAPTMEELHSKYFGKDPRSGMVNYGKGTRFNTRSGN